MFCIHSRLWLAGAGSFLLLLAGCAQEPVPPAADTRNVADEPRVAQRPVTQDATLGDELVAIEVDHPEEVPVGSSYQYVLKVTNNSDDKTFHGVTLKQQLGKGFTIENSEPNHSGDNEAEAMWRLSTLMPGETKTVTVTAASDTEGPAQMCLAIDYTPAICVAARFVKPEILVTKQAPLEASLCAPIDVIYTVHNSGSGDAANVVLVDKLDEGLTTIEGAQEVRADLGTIPAGESKDFGVKLVAQRPGQFGTRATAAMGVGEKQQEVRSNSVAIDVRAAQLQVTLEGPDAEYIKRPMDYQLRVKNVGNAIAQQGLVALAVPPGVNIVRMGDPRLAANADVDTPAVNAAERLVASQADEDLLEWKIGDLAPGSEVVMGFTAMAGTAAELKYEAVASFLCAGEEAERVVSKASTQTDIIALPALLVFAVDNEDPININGDVIYTIGVRNQGDAKDTNVQVVATLPEQLEFVDAKGPTKGSAEGNKVTFEKLKELAPGAQATWQVRAKANQEGEVILSVETTSDGFSKPVTSEEPTKLFKAQ